MGSPTKRGAAAPVTDDDDNDAAATDECRLCAETRNARLLKPITDKLRGHVFQCFAIEINSFDRLPQNICYKCQVVVENFHSVMLKYQQKQLFFLEKLKARKEANTTATATITQTNKDGNEISINVNTIENENNSILSDIKEENIDESNDKSPEKSDSNVVTSNSNPTEIITKESDLNLKTSEQIKSETSDNNVSNFSVNLSKNNQQSDDCFVIYNCAFCRACFNSLEILKKHVSVYHENLIKLTKNLKRCCVVLDKLNINNQGSQCYDWVCMNKNLRRKFSWNFEFYTLSKHTHLNRLAEKSAQIIVDDIDNDVPIRYLSKSTNSSASEKSVKCTKDLKKNDKNHKKKDDDAKYNKSPENTVKKVNSFKSNFMERIQKGHIELLWVSSENSLCMPQFSKKSLITKHSTKRDGLCANMIGLKPYYNQQSKLRRSIILANETENETENFETVKTTPIMISRKRSNSSSSNVIVTTDESSNLKKLKVSTNNDESTLPKIVSTFSLPVRNVSVIKETNNVISDPKPDKECRKPIIKCKPASVLMGNQESLIQNQNVKIVKLQSSNEVYRNVLENHTIGIPQLPKTSQPMVLNSIFNSRNDVTSINTIGSTPSNSNLMTITGDPNIQKKSLSDYVIIPKVNISNNQLFLQTSPSVNLLINQNNNLSSASTNTQNRTTNTILTNSSSSKNLSENFLDGPFFKLVRQIEEKGIKIVLKPNISNEIYRSLLKFKIVINEMYKDGYLSKTFHVKLCLLEDNGFLIHITNSEKTGEDLTKWSYQYQNQLIRAFQQPTVLNSIAGTIASNSCLNRSKINILLESIRIFKM